MRKEKAKALIPEEWRRWRRETNPADPTQAEGLVLNAFFRHLETNRPDLLIFQSSEPKLLFVRNLLRYAGELR